MSLLSLTTRTVFRSATSIASKTALKIKLIPFQNLSRFNSSFANNRLNKSELPFTYSVAGPSEVKYTKNHEWVSVHDDYVGFLGITKYAANALGDATYVELPELNANINADESIGSVESVKSASEIYMPVKGKILSVNNELEASPQLINEDPLGKGWMAKFQADELTCANDLNNLFTLEQYERFLKTDDETEG